MGSSTSLSLPFAAPPSASPDGGTWVGVGSDSSIAFIEEFGQLLNGLSIGTNYEISWYESNFGADFNPQYIQPNQFDVKIDSTSIGTGALLPLGEGWFSASLSFMATAVEHDLSFTLLGDGPSYMGIDGISMSVNGPTPPPSAVPVPAAVWLFGTALIGFISVSRRRKIA